MSQETKKASLAKRILVCVFGAFWYASGVAFTKNCNMGISPIVSAAYALSLWIPGLTLGWATSVINFVCFGIQKALLGKKYTLQRFITQFIMSLAFSVMLDFTAVIWAFVQPGSYVVKLITFLFGCAVLAFGVVTIASSNFEQLAAEGVVSAIVERTGFKFGNVKIAFDATMVLICCVITFCFCGGITGVREGTLIAVLMIGTFAKMIGPRIGPVYAKFLKG